MSTERLEDPSYVKPDKKVIDERGKVFNVPERRVKQRDNRLLQEEIDDLYERGAITAEEKIRLEVINSPSKWASVYLADPENNSQFANVRFYQEDILETPSRFKIYRLGRQCLTGDTLIHMADGYYTPIIAVKPGDQIYAFDSLDQKIVIDTVTDQWSNGIKKVYRITTDYGRKIQCTSNHPFYANRSTDRTSGKWMSIDNGLSVHSKIAMVKKTNRYSEYHIAYETIEEIEEIGEHEVYHISVQNHHTFIANEFVTHNTGKCVFEDNHILMPDGTQPKAGELYKTYGDAEFDILSVSYTHLRAHET